jgi:hypothetical protein
VLSCLLSKTDSGLSLDNKTTDTFDLQLLGQSITQLSGFVAGIPQQSATTAPPNLSTFCASIPRTTPSASTDAGAASTTLRNTVSLKIKKLG